MNLVDQLLTRVNDHAKAPGLRDAVRSAATVAEAFASQLRNVKADPNLTETGRSAAIKDALASTFAPALAKAQGPLALAAMALRTERAKFDIAVPDKTDLAGALERQEIRAMVRAMTPNERIAFLMASNEDLVADAVLTAPKVLTGLSENHFAEFKQMVLDRRFGQDMAEVREIDSVISEASAAIQVLTNSMATESGLDSREFVDAMGTQKPGGTPWLIKSEGKVLRVMAGRMVYPEATAGEIADGKFYRNIAEFERDHGADVVARMTDAGRNQEAIHQQSLAGGA